MGFGELGVHLGEPLLGAFGAFADVGDVVGGEDLLGLLQECGGVFGGEVVFGGVGELHVPEGEEEFFDAVVDGGIGGASEGAVEDREGLSEEGGGDGGLGVPGAEGVERGVRGKLIFEVEKVEDVGGGWAVVALAEVVADLEWVLGGVPEELGGEVLAEFGEFAAGGLVVGLDHDAVDAVGGVEFEVFGEAGEVLVGGEVVAEVGRVVPDEDAACEFAPLVDPEGELGAEGGLFEAAEVVADVAEADDDVGAGLGEGGWLDGIRVSEGFDPFVGVFGGDFIGDGVDEAEDWAGLGTSLGGDDGFAVVAFAGTDAVVLGDVDDGGGGVIGDPLEDFLFGEAEDVGVGEAELGVDGLADALAVVEGEVFGVGFEIGVGWDELAGGMDEGEEFEFAAGGGVAGRAGAVEALAGGDLFREGIEVVGFAVHEGRSVGVVERGEGEIGLVGDDGAVPGEEADVEIFFEEDVDAVEVAAGVLAKEGDVGA